MSVRSSPHRIKPLVVEGGPGGARNLTWTNLVMRPTVADSIGVTDFVICLCVASLENCSSGDKFFLEVGNLSLQG